MKELEISKSNPNNEFTKRGSANGKTASKINDVFVLVVR